jgi:cysteine desulfurase
MTDLQAPPEGFLDAVGGGPLGPETAAALARAAEVAWADPARLHRYGRRAAHLLSAARSSLAAGISSAAGVALSADAIWFTPSPRLAAAAAVTGVRGVREVAISTIETLVMHDAVAALGLPVREVAVDGTGRLELTDAALGPGTLLVAQAANVEIGTVQRVSDDALGGGFRVADASHLLARLPVPAPWSLLVADARSWGGPSGVQVLAVHPSAAWSPTLPSEGGWIGGSPDVPAAVAAATALEVALPRAAEESARLHDLVDRLRARIESTIPDLVCSGDPVLRLPHVLNCSVLYVSGEALVVELDRRGFAVASGSACVADSDRASHVLVAIGAFTGGNLRISLPSGCPDATIDRFADELADAVGALRREAGR